MPPRVKARKLNNNDKSSDTPVKARAVCNEEDVMMFSFKHLQLNHPKNKFCIQKKGPKYFSKLFERFKDVSTQKATDVRKSGGSSLRAHPITWKITSEPKGFSHLDEQLQSITPYQFQISSNENGRVHGFFIDNVFYAVWLDPEHELYP